MFSFVFLCLLFIGCKYAASSPVSVPEYEFVREADASLRLHIVPATWADAAVRCQLEDGVLASPTNGAMADAMLNMMEEYNIASNSVFIGLTDRFSKGEYRSLDGSDFAKINLEWASGEPDNAGNAEDCLVLTDAGALADVSCSSVLPYFCRKNTYNCTTDKDIISLNYAEPQCGGNGYQFEPLTGSCYKFHRDPHEFWAQALYKCHSEGAHLAIINSKEESAVLRKIFKQHPEETYRNHVMIGFRKWDDGQWATIHGEKLAAAGFDEWAEGEPNNFVDPENCGAIYRDGRLNDVSCTYHSYPFICEKTPESFYNKDVQFTELNNDD